MRKFQSAKRLGRAINSQSGPASSWELATVAALAIALDPTKLGSSGIQARQDILTRRTGKDRVGEGLTAGRGHLNIILLGTCVGSRALQVT